MNVQNIKKIEEGRYTIESFPCGECLTTVLVHITGAQIWEYNQGAHVQDVIPEAPADIRERFISGICGACWTKMFLSDDICEG